MFWQNTEFKDVTAQFYKEEAIRDAFISGLFALPIQQTSWKQNSHPHRSLKSNINCGKGYPELWSLFWYPNKLSNGVGIGKPPAA